RPAPLDALTIERHLEECGDCRTLYGSLQRVLNMVDSLPVPERPADYGERVWERIQHQLPARRPLFGWGIGPWRWAALGTAAAALLVTAFLAGRAFPTAHRGPVALNDNKRSEQRSEQVLRVAMGDYLERSQMMLVELTNAEPKGTLDISAEQERA